MPGPLNKFVRRLPNGKHLYTVGEAAAEIGRSADTLRRWRKRGLVGPSKEVNFERHKVYLYTEADIRELRKYVSSTEKAKAC